MLLYFLKKKVRGGIWNVYGEQGGTNSSEKQCKLLWQPLILEAYVPLMKQIAPSSLWCGVRLWLWQECGWHSFGGKSRTSNLVWPDQRVTHNARGNGERCGDTERVGGVTLLHHQAKTPCSDITDFSPPLVFTTSFNSSASAVESWGCVRKRDESLALPTVLFPPRYCHLRNSRLEY